MLQELSLQGMNHSQNMNILRNNNNLQRAQKLNNKFNTSKRNSYDDGDMY